MHAGISGHQTAHRKGSGLHNLFCGTTAGLTALVDIAGDVTLGVAAEMVRGESVEAKAVAIRADA